MRARGGQHLRESDAIRAEGGLGEVPSSPRAGPGAVPPGKGRFDLCAGKSLSAGPLDLCRRIAPLARARRRITARPFSRRGDGGVEAVQPRATDESLLRPERRAAGGRHPANGARSRRAGNRRRGSHRTRHGRRGAQFAECLFVAGGAIDRPGICEDVAGSRAEKKETGRVAAPRTSKNPRFTPGLRRSSR